MRKIIARKVNMTQIFSETGEVFPVTVVIEDAKGLAEKGQTLDDLQGKALQVIQGLTCKALPCRRGMWLLSPVSPKARVSKGWSRGMGLKAIAARTVGSIQSVRRVQLAAAVAPVAGSSKVCAWPVGWGGSESLSKI